MIDRHNFIKSCFSADIIVLSCSKLFLIITQMLISTMVLSGHDVNFCSDLPRRASEIQFSLALLQLSLALEKLYIIIL